MTTTTRPRKSRKAIAAELASAHRMIEMHTRLLAVAMEYGESPETDSQRRSITEWQDELEHVIDEAAAAGYVPEDFE